ncbi:hypothetical protein CUV01_07590 [Paracoccus tegillarcae]|uniref:Uncharacterized protein n=1 Tax=Paracoccus tegillarcae TaxID=1529068 RepID=A0A2K9EP77_9RHOB|nr:hypothetical protein CUV01_07590 [Paracoccus tegillarcae]
MAVAITVWVGNHPAGAAEGTDPTWPCIQRKQPHLSIGQMWAGPPPDDATTALSRDPGIQALAARLEQRRLPIEEAEVLITDFAEAADNDQLTALMQAILDKIEPERTAMIEGIARYGQKQVELARMIEDRRASLSELEAADPPDFDAIDAEEKALDWDERIFTDRQHALTYVCESPVLLEQRAFALARAIAGHLE